MAHFAEIDKDNKVIRVLAACNQDIADNGGELSEQAAKHFETVCPLSSNGEKWVQTSYNHNFRKHFGGKTFTYDAAKDKFIPPQPHASWTLDANDDWQAPIAYPSIISEDIDQSGETVTVHFPYIKWDEANQKWIGQKANSSTGSGLVDIEWDPGAGVWNTLQTLHFCLKKVKESKRK